MSRDKIIRWGTTIVLALCFLFLSDVSIATTQRVPTVEAGKTSAIQRTKYNSPITENMQISFENLTSRPDLYCVEHGAPLTSVKSENNPDKDSTIEYNGGTRIVRQLDGTLTLKSSQFNYTKNQPDAQNPYGTNGTVVATGRTIATYNDAGTRELRPSEALIYSEKKDTTASYPDYTQSAVWLNLERVYGNTNVQDTLNESLDNATQGRVLSKAGQILEDTMNKWNQFKEANNGLLATDQTDYVNIKKAVDKNKGTVLVGPFKLNYVRGVYKPTTLLNSKLVNSDGVMSFAGITDMKIYADSGMTKEINYKFVYPEVDGAGKRIKVTSGDDLYRYPYPGEEFYIQMSVNDIRTGNIDLLSNAEIKMENTTASGTATRLEGSITELTGTAKDNEIVCNCQIKVCEHGRTTPHKLPNGSYCVPQYCYKHRTHKVGDGHLQGHDYSIEVTAKGTIAAQKLDAKKDAIVENHTNYVTVPLGQNNPYGAYPSFIPFLPYRTPERERVPHLPTNPEPNKPDKPDEPEEPEEPEPGVTLTFDIAGYAWVDNFLGKETLANGLKDAGEEGVANIIVRLYKVGKVEPIKETLTDSNGHYKFQYVKIADDYYVEFTYDGMTYRTTSYLQSGIDTYAGQDMSAINAQYKAHTANYTNASNAIERLVDRTTFNSKFLQISNNMAVGTGGAIPLSYRTYMSQQGAVSALLTTDTNYVVADQFQMTASTKTTGLYYLLDDKYVVDTSNLEITTIDGKDYYVATYPGTLNINLGLIKREKADFAVKNDVYQTIVTMKENIQTYKYNNKSTNALTYDAYTRDGAYYTDSMYTQKIDKADYNWRYDTSYGEYANIVKNAVSLQDELNVYVEYKYLIRNQSPSQFGAVLELINHFDSSLEYSSSYDFTGTTSWIETNMIDEDNEVYKQPISWDVKNTTNGYTTMTTTGLKDKVLISGETLELHVILKVKKDSNRNIMMDLEDNQYKDNIIEIGTYSFNEGLIDRDSNPGNVVIEDTTTYEDDTDTSPFVKLVFNNYEENNGSGKVLSGYVWEDLADKIMSNNLYTGNGFKDAYEKGISNVKAELVEVLMDKVTGNELEILKKVGDSYSVRTDSNGQYKFTNLPTGTYKVKFTYGDLTQLQGDITYNGQDYKSVTTDTLKQQYENPGLEVMVLADTSESMTANGKDKIVSESAKELIQSLYNKVQTVKIGGVLFSEPKTGDGGIATLATKPNKNSVLSLFDNIKMNSGTTLASAIDSAIAGFTQNAASKVIVICTDGYINSDIAEALTKAQRLGIKVISVVSSTDEWPLNSFGTESSPTSGKLYYVRDVNIPEYITEVAQEDVLQEFSKILSNTLYAKDVQKEYTTAVDSNIGNVYTRQKNIDYTTSMTYANGSVVDGKDTKNISVFANNTQMTAITPIRNVMIENNNSNTANANLGLIERPKVELQIREEVSRIKVTLSDGQTIIDTSKDMTQNVQVIPNAKYNIFLDDEIMQGATLNVKYKVTVFNNGHVDTLGEYFDYDMYNQGDVTKYTSTIATRVGTIYSYYTNLTFRAEDNSNWEIEANKVNTNVKLNGAIFSNWATYVKSGHVYTPEFKDVEAILAPDGKSQVLSNKAIWEAKNLVKTGVEDDSRIKSGSVKIAQTNSLNSISLYPVISKESINKAGLSSVSTYIEYSKVLSPNDITDTLEYKQSVEIVERLNDAGRRDYVAVPGNYSPHSNITEYDSAKVADIVILNPFGENKQNTYMIWITAAMVAMIGGVIFIKRKVLKNNENLEIE